MGFVDVHRNRRVLARLTIRVRPACDAPQLGGRRGKRSDELVHQHPVQSPGGGAIRPVLQPAKRGTRSQRLELFDGRLPGRVPPQGVVIVEVFVPMAQAVDALAQQRLLRVFNQAGSRGSGSTCVMARVSPSRWSSWRNSGSPPSLVTPPPAKLTISARFFMAGNLKSPGVQTVSAVTVGCVFISPQ
jgi:hypothetical protein